MDVDGLEDAEGEPGEEHQGVDAQAHAWGLWGLLGEPMDGMGKSKQGRMGKRTRTGQECAGEVDHQIFQRAAFSVWRGHG